MKKPNIPPPSSPPSFRRASRAASLSSWSSSITNARAMIAAGVDPAAMAEYLMHKCACSTTVKTGADKRTCVFVQGDCTPMLDGALQDLYGVPKKLVRIDDRTKKAKNKKK